MPRSISRSSEVLLLRLRDHLPRYKNQRQMADRIGIHEGTLSRWFKRKQVPNPSLEQLEAIARELGLSVSALVSGDAPPPPRPQRKTIDGARVRRQLYRIATLVEQVAKDLPE